MDFLGDNSDAISALSSVLGLIITGLLACFTIYYSYRTRQSQKLVEKRFNIPKIVVHLRRDEVNTSCLIVCVENVGTGTALNVRFALSYSFQILGEIALEDIGFLKKGIDYFGSGQEHKFPINTIMGEEAWNKLMQTPLEIKITYDDSAGEEHVENVNLDFGAFESVPLVKSPIGAISGTAKEMVNATEKMVRATKDIGREFNQYTDLRAGDEVRTLDEFKEAMIDGYDRQRTTIPKGAICTVLEVTQEDITIEWDEASDEEGGRVIHRGLRTLSRRKLEREKIKLPPKQ